MKIFMACLLACYCMIVQAQSFQKNIGGEKFDRALFIDHTRDGGYIICGYSNSFSSSHDIYLVKTDDQGDLQWQKTFGGNMTDVGWGVKELGDGSYLLFGGIGIDSTNDDVLVVKLDKLGNETWRKTYGNQNYERCTQMLATPDGNYLFVGQRNSGPGGNIDSYIFKISPEGTLLWELVSGGPHVERTFYGAVTADGNYLVSGLILPHGNSKADILLLLIGPGGQLKWQKTIGLPAVHEIAHSFTANRDQRTFTMTGYSETTRPGFHEALFLQVDAEGNLLTNIKYDTGEDIRLMHAERTPDDGFIATGYARTDITSNFNNAVLMKFNRKGNIEWQKRFGQPALEDQGYWVIVNPDGGYTLTGYTHSTGVQGDLWLIRTDAKGN